MQTESIDASLLASYAEVQLILCKYMQFYRVAQKYGIFGQIACVRPLLAQASVAALDFVACHSVAEGGEYL